MIESRTKDALDLLRLLRAARIDDLVTRLRLLLDQHRELLAPVTGLGPVPAAPPDSGDHTETMRGAHAPAE